MQLSIVIVNWNSKNYVRDCLKNIELTKGKLQIQTIVVDGASFDGCDQMIASEFPSTNFVQSLENKGFGHANNLGVEHARASLLLLLNPDTIVHSGAIKSLFSTLTSRSNVGLVGAKLLNTDGTLQRSSVLADPTPLNQALSSDLLHKHLPRSSLWKTHKAYSTGSPTSVDSVSGACMATYTDLFRKVSGFSPEFFMYSEDLDLCYKIRQEGKEVFYDPNAIITHHGGGSTSTQKSKNSIIALRSSLYIYIKKRNGMTTASIYLFAQQIIAILRISLLSIMLLHRRSPSFSKRNTSRKKWVYILKWSFGLEKSISISQQNPIKGKSHLR